MDYTLIIQNNASKEFFIISGLTDSVDNHLYHKFEDVELQIPAGEYDYILLPQAEGVEHILRTPLITSSFIISGETHSFKELTPPTGILIVEGEEKEALWVDEPVFENQEEENNSTIYYYNG